MARTQATGTQILDGTVFPVDLSDEVVPFIAEQSLALGVLPIAKVINVLLDRQYIVKTELINYGTLNNNGTVGIV